MKAAKKWRQEVLPIALMLALLVAVCVSLWARAKRMERIPYLEHMDDTAVTVDGTKYRLRDLAVYLAHQEWETEGQAKVYDLEHTSKYWNLHANGSFIRVEARDMAMDLAKHDIIFCQMATEEGLELSEEELAYLQNQIMDFWNDLEEEGQIRLGVSEEEVEQAFRQIGLAQKMQQILADRQGVDYREYNVNGSLYQELLQEHSLQINEKLWKRLNFGNITIH